MEEASLDRIFYASVIDYLIYAVTLLTIMKDKQIENIHFLIAGLCIGVYMFLFEYFFKTTIGGYILGLRLVSKRSDGVLTAKQVLIRTLLYPCRNVYSTSRDTEKINRMPDRKSNTEVIYIRSNKKLRKSKENKVDKDA